jgi:hypothetical protein
LAAFASISPAGIAGRPDVDVGDLATLSLWWRQRLTLQPKPATNAKHCTKIATLVNRSVSRDPYLVPDAWNNAFWIATSIAGVVVFFLGDCLGALKVHEHTIHPSRVPDRAWRLNRTRRWYLNWRFLTVRTSLSAVRSPGLRASHLHAIPNPPGVEVLVDHQS